MRVFVWANKGDKERDNEKQRQRYTNWSSLSRYIRIQLVHLNFDLVSQHCILINLDLLYSTLMFLVLVYTIIIKKKNVVVVILLLETTEESLKVFLKIYLKIYLKMFLKSF
jgi:hypothetical protein